MRGRPFEFWSAVDKSGDCWEWTMGRNGRSGYGMWRGKLSHRVAWEMERGQIPAGMLVCHRCDNPLCVRPEHLFLGTQSDNMRDRNAKGRNYPTTGRNNGRAKLTEEEVRIIRRMAEYFTQKEIAGFFKIPKETVSHIVTRRTWAHLS